jgi:hypothetical protein
MSSKIKKRNFDQVLTAFSEGKIISENVTLKQIAEVSKRIESDGLGGGELAAWTFVSPNYVYTGDDEVQVARNINIS